MWFTLEYVLRLAVAPRKLHFLFGFMNLIDLAAILPYYVTSLVTRFMNDEYLEHLSDVRRVLQILRVLRILRVLKRMRVRLPRRVNSPTIDHLCIDRQLYRSPIISIDFAVARCSYQCELCEQWRAIRPDSRRSAIRSRARTANSAFSHFSSELYAPIEFIVEYVLD